MDSLPIVIPAAPADPRRPPVPIVAALVPVGAGVALWLITDSLYALCFAALGPLMIFASLVDGARARRKARRDATIAGERAWADAEIELAARHDEERAARWHLHPDAAVCLSQPPLRGGERPAAATEIVIGSGASPSGLRASGGDGARERDFQRRCGTIERVPVAVALGGGIALRGPSPIVAAVARALVVQLCSRFGPRQLALAGEAASELGVNVFPHFGRSRRGAFLLGVVHDGDEAPDSDAAIWMLTSGADVPEGVTTVMDLQALRGAKVRTPQGILDVDAEGLSRAQAEAAGVRRAGDADDLEVLPDAVALSDLAQAPAPHGLAVAIGRGDRDTMTVDLVDDGPHAIVTGTTGAGKSELLVTWVTAMAGAYGPDRVLFVLADFKGGTAFEPLRVLPHVAAVITDLDDEGARRGVSSLTAELRRREMVIASAGARDISDVAMPRLVIVVDEFAALLQDHTELGGVFTDIAARGRALGMHLIIGTQRAAGVIRDALAANCPLRLSLRVSDAGDSRAVLGTDAAAELPGGLESRGIAFLRRPRDHEPTALRVALTGAADLRAAALLWPGADQAVSPWLPVLPRRIPLAEIGEAVPDGWLVLGRADDPQRQAQPLEVIRPGADRGLSILGAPGSGRTSALRLLAEQSSDALWIPRDAESAWDTVTGLAERTRVAPSLILCDDIDLQIGDVPIEHGQHLAQLWEQLIRGAVNTTIVLAASRSSGPLGRILDSLPRRALLRMPNRVEHLAAGGEAQSFDRDRPPGRAVLGDREIQVAWVEAEHQGHDESAARGAGERLPWAPATRLTALVTTGARSVAASLAEAYPWCTVTVASAQHTSVEEGIDRPVIVVGEAETWQRDWTLWQRARSEGEVLIRAENPVELRQLAGIRQLAPYARPHAGRAWSLQGDGIPERVVIPALTRR
ncbi:FtsK/SpoIIIE domain-containing protein [Microbacterium sp. UFMG61]|uniref:FtsK/SpoIIIE domain-containing protein n=1 Tax=Microbacterium sp. UFMG61 TaxID=2745935 RepID=UPI00188F1136|nr:FtsK/SpoIIIE domain-containing protein [Microbacterium sp. UFMG61]